jgi:hypothetical protein
VRRAARHAGAPRAPARRALTSRLPRRAVALLGVSVGGFATISSLCSQVVPHRLVGEAQGVLNAMKALMEGIGPLAFAWMIPRFEDTPLPGAPWLISAACMAAAGVLCLWLEAFTDEAVHAHQMRAGCCDCSDEDGVAAPLVANGKASMSNGCSHKSASGKRASSQACTARDAEMLPACEEGDAI